MVLRATVNGRNRNESRDDSAWTATLALTPGLTG